MARIFCELVWTIFILTQTCFSAQKQELEKQAKNAVQDGFFYNSSVIVVADDNEMVNKSNKSPQSVFFGPGMSLKGMNVAVSQGQDIDVPNSAEVLEALSGLAQLIEADPQQLNQQRPQQKPQSRPSSKPSNNHKQEIQELKQGNHIDTQISEAEEEWLEQKAPGKETFSVTMDGMMEALMEVQRRGDRMMQGIQKQKKILTTLEKKVNEEETRMKETQEVRLKEESKLEQILKRRRSIEQEARRSESMLHRITQETRKAEQRRSYIFKEAEAMEKTLMVLESQKNSSEVEVERLKKQLVPLVEEFSNRRIELESIQGAIKDKKSRLQKYSEDIVSSTNSLNELRTTITKEQNAVDKLDKTSLTTSSAEIPFLLPMFLLSLLGNIVVGGQIVTNAFSGSNRRSDTVAQLIGSKSKGAGGDANKRMDWASPAAPEVTNSEEKRFENMYAPEGYYNLPRYF